MIEVPQRLLHDPDKYVFGDCWKCCVASILELPYEEVPHFGERVNCWESYFKWLHSKKLDIDRYHPPHHPLGYSMAVGPSPRFAHTNHCVVYLDDKLVFDPHPTKLGITKVLIYETFKEYP